MHAAIHKRSIAFVNISYNRRSHQSYMYMYSSRQWRAIKVCIDMYCTCACIVRSSVYVFTYIFPGKKVTILKQLDKYKVTSVHA